MNAFFGLLLLIGRFIKKDNNALSRRFYAAVMSRNIFTDILRYIRFDDSVTREARKTDDKLAPIRHVTDIFVENCKSCYNASDIGCVDEQLVTFRGRCSLKVYMPSKPGKYGIKIWALYDSKTFYSVS
ncbi:PiggyBac transposable element-derived protein 4 [Anthophora quadrimaculata]